MATNEFKAFATGAGANVITQAEYEALASLAAGFSAGTARSNELNKVWRQASIMAAVLAQLIVDQTGHDALDDGTTSALLENLKSAIQGLGSAQPASTTVAGIIEIATNAEHVAGASGGLAATPAGIAAVLQGAMMTYAVGSGSANAHTATYTPAVSTLVDGMVLRFRAANANTGAATFSPNGLAAKPIVKRGLSALTGGEIAAGADVWLQYNASVGGWVMTSGGQDILDSVRIDVASAATVDLTVAAPNTRHINITGATAISAFTVAAGRCYFVRFAGALTLNNGASLVTNTGGNIVTAAGDTCIIRATAANTVEVMAYSPGALSVAQDYTNMTASRAFDTLYTNTTGRWRFVIVTPVAASSKTYGIEIGGNAVGGLAYGSAAIKSPMFFAVPPGKTYRITTTGTPTLETWMEA